MMAVPAIKLRRLSSVDSKQYEIAKPDSDSLLPEPSSVPSLELPGPSKPSLISPSRLSSSSSPLLSDDVVEATQYLTDTQCFTLNSLISLFTDADPLHLVELISNGETDDVCLLADQLFKNGYPKLRVRKEKESIRRRREKMIDETAEFNVQEFLRIFPDPETYFLSEQRISSDLYIEHCHVFLANKFPAMRTDFFAKLLANNGQRLLPTYREIMEGEERTVNGRRKKRKNFGFPQFMRKARFIRRQYPETLDESFFRELQYCLHQTQVQEHLVERAQDRQRRFDIARDAGLLRECPICLVDELLEDEEMCHCDAIPSSHFFCRDCCLQHAQTQIANGAHFVRCMDSECTAGQLSLATLQTILPGKMLQLFTRRMQREELRAANLGDIDSCPFCDFAMIIDNENERLFKCLNPECLRESCRECREESHIPLRCDEVDKEIDVKMRTFVENAMAEALIRKCPSCSQPIVKSDGCNKMTCPCGTYFCYVCNAKLEHTNPYTHFRNGSKCEQSTPIEKLHDETALKAGEEAKLIFASKNVYQKMKDVNVEALVSSVPRKPRTLPAAVPATPPALIFHRPPSPLPMPDLVPQPGPIVALPPRPPIEMRDWRATDPIVTPPTPVDVPWTNRFEPVTPPAAIVVHQQPLVRAEPILEELVFEDILDVLEERERPAPLVWHNNNNNNEEEDEEEEVVGTSRRSTTDLEEDDLVILDEWIKQGIPPADCLRTSLRLLEEKIETLKNQLKQCRLSAEKRQRLEQRLRRWNTQHWQMSTRLEELDGSTTAQAIMEADAERVVRQEDVDELRTRVEQLNDEVRQAQKALAKSTGSEVRPTLTLMREALSRRDAAMRQLRDTEERLLRAGVDEGQLGRLEHGLEKEEIVDAAAEAAQLAADGERQRETAQQAAIAAIPPTDPVTSPQELDYNFPHTLAFPARTHPPSPVPPYIPPSFPPPSTHFPPPVYTQYPLPYPRPLSYLWPTVFPYSSSLPSTATFPPPIPYPSMPILPPTTTTTEQFDIGMPANSMMATTPVDQPGPSGLNLVNPRRSLQEQSDDEVMDTVRRLLDGGHGAQVRRALAPIELNRARKRCAPIVELISDDESDEDDDVQIVKHLRRSTDDDDDASKASDNN